MLLGPMHVVQPGLASPGKLAHLRPDLLPIRVCERPAPVAVYQNGGALVPIRRQVPPHLSLREGEQLDELPSGQLAPIALTDYLRPLVLRGRKCHCLPHAVTVSLTSCLHRQIE